MRYFVVICKFIPANAMALYPLILIKDPMRKKDLVLLNHEKIHLQQQLELLIIPFYILYFINYVVNFLKYTNHYQAYLNISFEREAYLFDKDLNYLAGRKLFKWINYLK
jgi:hypothetical protein